MADYEEVGCMTDVSKDNSSSSTNIKKSDLIHI